MLDSVFVLEILCSTSRNRFQRFIEMAEKFNYWFQNVSFVSRNSLQVDEEECIKHKGVVSWALINMWNTTMVTLNKGLLTWRVRVRGFVDLNTNRVLSVSNSNSIVKRSLLRERFSLPAGSHSFYWILICSFDYSLSRARVRTVVHI